MNVIEISHLTRDYGHGRGIFDLSLSIGKGEIFGFLGPNGAGKTTTIRHLMGFLPAVSGSCKINGLDCMKDAAAISKKVGYIPGEINFMDEMSGSQFIEFMAGYRGLKSLDRAKALMERFELNASGKIRKMSKGMKQKVAIVCAFMHDPDILILDEPTSGLDPLMQNVFTELILEEKERGKTIFMSSHMMEEVEKTCGRVCILKDGHTVSTEQIETLKAAKKKIYTITLADAKTAEDFARRLPVPAQTDGACVSVKIKNHLQELIKLMNEFDIKDIDIRQMSLEDFFMQFYGGDKNGR